MRNDLAIDGTGGSLSSVLLSTIFTGTESVSGLTYGATFPTNDLAAYYSYSAPFTQLPGTTRQIVAGNDFLIRAFTEGSPFPQGYISFSPIEGLRTDARMAASRQMTVSECGAAQGFAPANFPNGSISIYHMRSNTTTLADNNMAIPCASAAGSTSNCDPGANSYTPGISTGFDVYGERIAYNLNPGTLLRAYRLQTTSPFAIDTNYPPTIGNPVAIPRDQVTNGLRYCFTWN